MKRILFLLLSVCILLSMSLSVYAESTVCDIKVDYTVNDAGNIVVNAAIVDITAEGGLFIIEYDIKYDSSAMKLVNANAKIPSAWEPYIENEMAEDISYPDESRPGTYVWCVLNAMLGCGISDDNAFTIELEFRPLQTGKTKVEFDSVYVGANDDIANLLKGGSEKIYVDINDIPDTNNSQTSSEPIESSTVDSSTVSSEIEPPIVSVPDEISKNENSQDESSQNEVSEESQDIPTESQDISTENSNTDVEISENSKNNESKSESIITVSQTIKNESSSINISEAEDSHNGNVFIIVGIVIVVIIAAVVGTIAFRRMKGKQ